MLHLEYQAGIHRRELKIGVNLNLHLIGIVYGYDAMSIVNMKCIIRVTKLEISLPSIVQISQVFWHFV